jgi:hypothetical protein
MISEEEFTAAREEARKYFVGRMEECDSKAGWEEVLNKDSIKLYRRQMGSESEHSVQYEYRVHATLTDMHLLNAAMSIWDMAFRSKWDVNLSSFKSLGSHLMYYEVKYPFPMCNRDYVYKRALRQYDGDKEIVMLAETEPVVSTQTPSAHSKNVRVGDYRQITVMKADPNSSGMHLYMRYVDSPGGWIPSWLVNWCVSMAVPNFLDAWRKASKEYVPSQQSSSSP